MKIGAKLGLTLQVGEREFVRPEFSVEEIDPEGDVDKQLELAHAGLVKAFNYLSATLNERIGEFIKGGKKK